MFFNIWCLSLLLLINSQKSDLLISAQEIDKDVEIITGKDMPQPPSMKFGLGRSYYVGDYYGPQVSELILYGKKAENRGFVPDNFVFVKPN